MRLIDCRVKIIDRIEMRWPTLRLPGAGYIRRDPGRFWRKVCSKNMRCEPYILDARPSSAAPVRRFQLRPVRSISLPRKIVEFVATSSCRCSLVTLEPHVARLQNPRTLTNHQKERSHRPQVTNRLLRDCLCFNRRMTLANDPPTEPVSTVTNHAPFG
jgi:hypothetical protein